MVAEEGERRRGHQPKPAIRLINPFAADGDVSTESLSRVPAINPGLSPLSPAAINYTGGAASFPGPDIML